MNGKAVLVLGGGMRKDNKGIWHTTNFGESGDKNGEIGDRLRVEAAAILFKNEPEISLIVSGGKGQLSDVPDAPPVAEILKKELWEKGVPEENMIKETESYNTFQQLKNLKNIIKENKLQRIKILSNGWHLPRVKAMLENLEELKDLKKMVNIEFVSAEEVLIENKPELWKEKIELAFASKSMAERIEKEKKGVEDLQKGNYKI